MKASSQADETLLLGLRLGDASAFREIVTRYHRRGCHHAWRIVQDHQIAEDVVQEQFLKLWRGRAQFDPARGAFWPWFARLITNAAIDHKRRLRLVEPLDAADYVVDPAPTADQLVESLQVRACMNALPQRQRAALALFYLEGFSMQDVADTLATTPKAVEALLSRGRDMLRQILAANEAEPEEVRA